MAKNPHLQHMKNVVTCSDNQHFNIETSKIPNLNKLFCEGNTLICVLRCLSCRILQYLIFSFKWHNRTSSHTSWILKNLDFSSLFTTLVKAVVGDIKGHSSFTVLVGCTCTFLPTCPDRGNIK